MGIASLEASSPDAVFAFLDASVSARGREHWRWKYRLDTPAEPRAFYHAGHDGTVGGFIGLLPTTLCTADGGVRAAWFVDWATRAGDGSVGVGVGLLRHAEARTDVLLTLQGSADTQMILPRLRWSEVATPTSWILRLSARALAERGPIRDSALLRWPARLAGAAAALYFRVVRPPAGELSLHEVARFPASYDTVWNERRAEFAPLMDRSSAQLNFMCADYPGGGYRRFLLHERDRVVGHVIVREDRHGGLARGRLVDALWVRGRPDMAEWLVREACWRLQERGVDYIDCTVSAPDFEGALQAGRFRRRSSVPIWYHRLPPGVPPPATWFITYLDCDRAYR